MLSLGNGLTTSYEYLDLKYIGEGNAHFGLLRSIVTGGLQGLTYAYVAKGNLSQLMDNDGLGSETVGFTYDHLDRLTDTTNAFEEAYRCDATGNIRT